MNFAEVKIYGEKSGKCGICGKSCKLRQKFYQTINPWNRNKDGKPKSREEIYEEIKKECNEWKKIPITHRKCKAS